MNIEKICRCCLALDTPLLSIYDGGSAGMGCVADMLKQIAKLLPQPSDNMPEKACLQCISEINRCFVFKMKCENSNRTLRQLLPHALPEQLESPSKKLLLSSSAVQTEEKILVSTAVQTVEDVSNSSVQTDDEQKPIFSHKHIQTDYQISQEHNESLENLYEEVEDQSTNNKRRASSLLEETNIEKKFCLENNQEDNLITVEDTQLPVEQSSNYLLLDDTNCSEEQEIHQKHFEYYEDEEVTKNDGSTNITYQENDRENDLLNDKNVYEIETSDIIEEYNLSANPTKSPTSSKAPNRPKGQYKCSHCIMTFVSIKVLKRHLAKRHDIKDTDLVIDYLPASDPDEETNVDDSSVENSAKIYNYNVELTSENVAKPQLMQRKSATSSVNEEFSPNIQYFCDHCHAGFAQRKTLTYHIKHQVCMASNYKCDQCGSIFVSEENLEAHKSTHENPHKCLECDTLCKTIDELSQHMIKNHNRSARNQCHICKKVFTMRTSLMDHLRIHSGEKPFLCTICGKSFRQNSNLRQHLIRHTNEKNFKCDVCSNAYVTKAELFSHKRTHTGDHPFKCDRCEARFTTSCSLKKHIRKHTGERPYACEFCPMHFAALNVLKNHRRIHTGEKPFKCAHCSRSFTQKGDCLMHERTHENNNEFLKCFCEAKFSKKSNLRHHIKTQHPDFSEKEIQALLSRTATTNDDTEYHITIMEDTEETGANSPKDDNENVNDVLAAIAEEKEFLSNDELLEIVIKNDVG